MNSNPTVSIGIPIYNVEKYIERCAVSLFAQTYREIEYIFVDDCSPDKSVSILKKVLESYPDRNKSVKIVRHDKNRGLGAARNTAMQNMTGEFMIWLDSDDYLDIHAVEEAVGAQQKTESDIVSFEGYVLFKNRIQEALLPDCSSPKEMAISVIRHDLRNSVWGRLIRRCLYIENDIHVEEGVNMSEDLQVTPKLFYHAKSICTLHKKLYYYDCTNVNAYTYRFSEKNARQFLRTIEILQDYFKEIEFVSAIKYRKAIGLADMLWNCCKCRGNGMFYIETRNRLKELYSEYRDYIPFIKRVAYLSNSYMFMHSVAIIVNTIRKFKQ